MFNAAASYHDDHVQRSFSDSNYMPRLARGFSLQTSVAIAKNIIVNLFVDGPLASRRHIQSKILGKPVIPASFKMAILGKCGRQEVLMTES